LDLGAACLLIAANFYCAGKSSFAKLNNFDYCKSFFNQIKVTFLN